MSASIESDLYRDWDECVAQDLLGSIVIVGLTYLDPEGQLECQFQISGLVAVVGMFFYSAGELIVDPHYVSTWTITRRARD